MVNRRKLLVGMAGLPFAAVPALASPAPDPDAALLDLIARHAAALAAREAHADALAAAEDRFAAACPQPPDVLLLRTSDAFGVGQHMGRTGDGRGFRGRWFDGNAVDALEAVTPAPELVGRRAEILAAFRAWEDDVDAMRERVGMAAAEREDDRLFEAVAEVETAVMDTVPVTLAGFRAKARWVAAQPPGGDWAEVLLWDLAGIERVTA